MSSPLVCGTRSPRRGVVPTKAGHVGSRIHTRLSHLTGSAQCCTPGVRPRFSAPSYCMAVGPSCILRTGYIIFGPSVGHIVYTVWNQLIWEKGCMLL